MTNTERLVEAVVYASENGSNWWEEFDSINDAFKILKGAQREDPDEGQIACLMSALDSEDEFEECTIDFAYKNVLKKLKKELEEEMDK